MPERKQVTRSALYVVSQNDKMRNIPVYQGGRITGSIIAFARVDVCDYAWLVTFRWNLNAKGYVVTQQGRKRLLMSRMILGLTQDDKLVCDHKNRDKLDNQRRNLRAVTRGVNAQNCSPKLGTSKYRGVSHAEGRKMWRAAARTDGRSIYLGSFDDELEAARVAREFRLGHYAGALD